MAETNYEEQIRLLDEAVAEAQALLEDADTNQTARALAAGLSKIAIAMKALLTERERLRSGLQEIAKQKLWTEMNDEETEDADWMEGYESCVRLARAALEPEK